MIKFFRNIRQNMIKENKVSKYLLYAIGEIMLVVIGIIIAVQIGEWNNNVKRQKLEKILLQQVKDELLYRGIENDLLILYQGKRSDDRILDYIQQNVTYVDSMCFDFYWLKKDEYMYPRMAVYEKIKEEGLDIIKNDSLKIYLQELFEYNYPRVSRVNPFYPDIGVFFSDYYLENFRPNTDLSLHYKVETPDHSFEYPREIITNGISRVQTIGYVPINFEALKKDKKFLMLMEESRRYRDYKIRQYESAKNIIERIIPLIDKELDND